MSIKEILLIVLLIVLVADCLAFHSDGDRDSMKEIGKFNDEKVPTNKRMLSDQKGSVDKQYPSVLDTTGDDHQTQGKRLKVESLPDDIVKTSKRQRYDNLEYMIKYESELNFFNVSTATCLGTNIFSL